MKNWLRDIGMDTTKPILHISFLVDQFSALHQSKSNIAPSSPEKRM